MNACLSPAYVHKGANFRFHARGVATVDFHRVFSLLIYLNWAVLFYAQNVLAHRETGEPRARAHWSTPPAAHRCMLPISAARTTRAGVLRLIGRRSPNFLGDLSYFRFVKKPGPCISVFVASARWGHGPHSCKLSVAIRSYTDMVPLAQRSRTAPQSRAKTRRN